VDLKELAKGAEASRASAQRAVEELCGEGMMRRVGEGKRGKPFRYFRLDNPSCPTSNIEGQKESGNRSESEAME
jgi:predicted transcriptional regulator